MHNNRVWNYSCLIFYCCCLLAVLKGDIIYDAIIVDKYRKTSHASIKKCVLEKIYERSEHEVDLEHFIIDT